MAIVMQYPPGFPPGDTSTATGGDDAGDAIDVGRILMNPNWTGRRDAVHDESGLESPTTGSKRRVPHR